MLILGIETSCDETAVAIVENGQTVHCNLIASSIQQHQAYGGIVPEIAARDQIKQILPLIHSAFAETKLTWDQIDQIAVTQTPGLISSLLVGINTAQTLAWLQQKPLVKVDHIKGHIYANWLERETKPVFPIMILTVSGGHNELYLMKAHDDFELIGESLDDAAGEAFDKVAKMLNLGYPGGPIVSQMAEKGNPEAYNFPRSLNQNKNFDFSFSGLKTSVLYSLQKECKQDPETSNAKHLKADICASFQAAVCDSLSKKLVLAAAKHKVNEIHLAGGVSANQGLRTYIKKRIAQSTTLTNTTFHYPSKISYCTDNAAMIAAAAYYS